MEIDIFQLPGILRRRWIYPAAAAAFGGLLALVFVLHQTPLYHASLELLLDPAGLQNPANSVDGVQSQSMGQLNTDSQIYIMQSSEVLSAVVNELNLQNDGWLAPPKSGGKVLSEDARTQEAITALKKNMSVLRADQSLVFTISIKHPAADKAAEIANAIGKTYLKLTDESRSGSATRASMTLQAQADELRKRLQKAQNEIEKYKAEHGLFSTVGKGLVSDQELESLNQQLATANLKLASQKTIYDQARRLSFADIQAGSIPEALQSTALVNLRTRYAQLLDTEAQLASNLGANHPQLKAARSQVASMKASVTGELNRIRESLKNTYLRAKADRDTLQARYDNLAKQTGESGDARTHLAQLESNAQALKTLYQSYLSKAEDLGGKQTVDFGSSRIISAAVPPSKASGAPKSLTIIAGLLFGSIVGTGLAVLCELMSGLAASSSRSMQKRHDKTGIPVVAMIPQEAKTERKFATAFRTFKKGATPEISSGRREAFARIAEMMRATFERDEAPVANVLFVLSEDMDTVDFPLQEIAQALSATGVPVYTPGEVAASKPVLVRQGPRIALALKAQPDPMIWGRGQVHFTTTGAQVPLLRVQKQQPTFYLASSVDPLVEGALSTLIEDADVVLAVSAQGTAKRELDALTDYLEPWHEKLLGMIMIGH